MNRWRNKSELCQCAKRQNRQVIENIGKVARPTGLEPVTHSLEGYGFTVCFQWVLAKLDGLGWMASGVVWRVQIGTEGICKAAAAPQLVIYDKAVEALQHG